MSKTLDAITLLSDLNNSLAEVIIINNNSFDNTNNIIIDFIQKQQSRIKVEYHIESKIGKSHAIKNALNHVSSKWIIFCDDDNILDANYLVSTTEIIKNDDSIGVLGGFSRFNFEDSRLPSWFHNYKSHYALGHQGNISQNGLSEVKYIWGAGMVIRKEIYVFLENNQLDLITGKKRYDYYISGEDYEISVIASILGYKICYSSKLNLYHNINEARINWESLVKLNIRNSIPLVYLKLYDLFFLQKNPISASTILSYIKKSSKLSQKYLFKAAIKKIFGFILNKKEGFSYDLSYNLSLAELKELKKIQKDVNHIVLYFTLLKKYSIMYKSDKYNLNCDLFS